MRVNRRRARRRRVNPWIVPAAVAVLAAAGVGGYLWQHRPQGLDAVAGSAIVASGAYQSKVGDAGSITVAVEIRNVADEPVTVVGARVVPPSGLPRTGLTVLRPDPRNSNLNLADDLPALAPITLGTNGVDRNGMVVARFSVACDDLPPATGATGEQMFVTVRLGADEREEELTPPVHGGTPLLTATARSACNQPTATGTAEPPLPPLP